MAEATARLRAAHQVLDDDPKILDDPLVLALLGDETRAQQLASEIRALDSSVTGKGLVHANSSDPDERQRFHDNLARFDLA